MTYYVLKSIYFFMQPSIVLLMLTALAAGLAVWRPGGRATRAALFAAVAGWIVGGLSPLANVLIYPLEQRFDRPGAATLQASPPAGIIVLGGFEDTIVTSGRGKLAVNESAERIIEAARLARQFANARIVFTGGVAELFLGREDAGGEVARLLADFGIASERIVIERASRTTWENALLTREMVAPKPGETWLLVTSAFHMPRSVGVFRKAGFDVVAYPVDHRTADAWDLLRPFAGVGDGLRRLDLATKEWVGLLGYWWVGRTSELFPGPR